jgi:hypothetical protein
VALVETQWLPLCTAEGTSVVKRRAAVRWVVARTIWVPQLALGLECFADIIGGWGHVSGTCLIDTHWVSEAGFSNRGGVDELLVTDKVHSTRSLVRASLTVS